jgi:Bacterial protein of unknown function (DUF899)
MVNGAYHFLDLVPKGRDEDCFKFSMEWLRRHDQYLKHFAIMTRGLALAPLSAQLQSRRFR